MVFFWGAGLYLLWICLSTSYQIIQCTIAVGSFCIKIYLNNFENMATFVHFNTLILSIVNAPCRQNAKMHCQNVCFPSYIIYKKRVNLGVELSLKLKVKILSVYQRIKVDKGFFKMREFLFIYLLKNV